MIRLNLVKGLGPVLQIAEGWTVDLPEEVSDKLWKRTDYTWPCTWFAPRCDGKEGAFKSAYDVMNNWGANHGAISYGHIGADLITMCSMLRIPVCMHNVPEENLPIFRPAACNVLVDLKLEDTTKYLLNLLTAMDFSWLNNIALSMNSAVNENSEGIDINLQLNGSQVLQLLEQVSISDAEIYMKVPELLMEASKFPWR